MRTNRFHLFFILEIFLLFSLIASIAQQRAGAEQSQVTTTVSTRWREIGPEGGEIDTLAIDPFNHNTVFAGGRLTGLFRSLDGGDNWMRIGKGLTSPDVTSVVPSIWNRNEVFLTTYQGLFASSDDGATWTKKLVCSGSRSYLTQFAIDKQDSKKQYLICSGRLELTDNGGNSWQQLAELSNLSFRYLVVGSTGYVYAIADTEGGFGKDHLLLKSVDGGTTWSSYRLPVNGDIAHIPLAISPSNPDILLLRTYGNATLLRSADGGASWRPVLGVEGGGGVAGGFVSFDPKRPNVAYAGGVFLYISVDAGNTFVSTDNAARFCGHPNSNLGYHVDVGAIAFDQSTNSTYIGTDGGVYVSRDDGCTWQWKVSGMKNALIHNFASDPFNQDTIIVVRQDYGFQITNDGGETWQDVITAQGQLSEAGDVEFDAKTPGVVYAAASGGVWKSTDHGKNFIQETTGLPNSSLFEYDVASIAIDPTNHSIIWVAGRGGFGLVKSIDGGEHWNRVGNFSSVDRIIVDGSIAFAEEYLHGRTDIDRTIDGGEHWMRLSFPSSGSFSDISVDSANDSNVYVTRPDGLFVSQNRGATFDNLSIPTDFYNQDLTILTERTNGLLRITLGSIWGTADVYQSIDGGKSWTSITGNLNITRITEIEPNWAQPDVLFLSTNGEGIVTNGNPTETHVTSSTSNKISIQTTSQTAFPEFAGLSNTSNVVWLTFVVFFIVAFIWYVRLTNEKDATI